MKMTEKFNLRNQQQTRTGSNVFTITTGTTADLNPINNIYKVNLMLKQHALKCNSEFNYRKCRCKTDSLRSGKMPHEFFQIQGKISALVFILLLSSLTTVTSGVLVNQNAKYYDSDNVGYFRFDQEQRGRIGGDNERLSTSRNGSLTTKRSLADNVNILSSLTTATTPVLTTIRYFEKSLAQQPTSFHNRHYELDLERDHALPTSAPNADILKSNSNPVYPNPNRHGHAHDRDRHRHYSSTPIPSLTNLLKKNNNSNGKLPTIPMYAGGGVGTGELPSYSPPARSFFTPPLPPEYQNPFADKPTLRGTNSEGSVAANAAGNSYINRRPIPPPSLMPGHERIPIRPQNALETGDVSVQGSPGGRVSNGAEKEVEDSEQQQKKTLNTAFYNEDNPNHQYNHHPSNNSSSLSSSPSLNSQKSGTKEVLPSIRRILSGSYGIKGDIPEVLLKQVTSKPLSSTTTTAMVSHQYPPLMSPMVIINQTLNDDKDPIMGNTNINQMKNTVGGGEQQQQPVSSTPSAAAAIGGGITSAATIASSSIRGSVSSSSSSSVTFAPTRKPMTSSSSSSSSFDSSAASASPASSNQSTWTIAWNIHIYLSVILYTVLAVYSLYKIFTFSKLTQLFSQYYFICIHMILMVISASRIFYLCYDPYNIHGSFSSFASEILLNLPATFLTIAFSVEILFLFLKSLNHKKNRYSALIRPLTIIVGCGVHVLLCITLHYVESYTMRNQLQQHQQQQQFYRRQQRENHLVGMTMTTSMGPHYTQQHQAATAIGAPPRVLSFICQLIYIFVCLTLGLLYLYLYRILKRILRSKSQNYIHGLQNLSYAIHITIATALLFVLLAALQIFGAFCISIQRPLITHVNAEIDWLQWGYQFSLRLIEIAIITLISWVSGLKVMSNQGVGGNPDGAIMRSMNMDGGLRLGGGTQANSTMGNGRGEKHSNVTNFFLPCTSSSSQEQFDTDYPAICNANTNLHTYTMRTGKLIYDDSFPLNALGGGHGGGGGAGSSSNHTDFSQRSQQPTYQHPYDTNSMRSYTLHQNDMVAGSQYGHHASYAAADYLTDNNTDDHYENPNYDLCRSKFSKALSTPSTTTSSNGGGNSNAESMNSSTAQQQQKLLIQHENCYSEPLQQQQSNSLNYEFNNFERPKFIVPGGESLRGKRLQALERSAYENSERYSPNSIHSCDNGGGIAGNTANSYHSFDRYGNNVRRSGTLNSIALSNHSSNTVGKLKLNTQTLATTDRHLQQKFYHPPQQQQQRKYNNHRYNYEEQDLMAPLPSHHQHSGYPSLERLSARRRHVRPTATSSATTPLDVCRDNDRMFTNESNARSADNGNDNDDEENGVSSVSNTSSTTSPVSPPPQATVSNSGSGAKTTLAEEASAVNNSSMLVADQGFVRFRALDDINNAQGVGIHNASIRKQNHHGIS